MFVVGLRIKIGRAHDYAKELTRLSEVTPEDKIAYSQMHLVFELIASMNEEEPDKTTLKTENRNKENRRQIIDFIADNVISDSKSHANLRTMEKKAIPLQKPSSNKEVTLILWKNSNNAY